jgi:hypothetical protein
MRRGPVQPAIRCKAAIDPMPLATKTKNIQPDADVRTIWRRMRLHCETVIGTRTPLTIEAA